MLSVFMCFYQNLVLVAEYHVDCDTHRSDVCYDRFPVPQKEHRKYQKLRMNNKVRGVQMQ